MLKCSMVISYSGEADVELAGGDSVPLPARCGCAGSSCVKGCEPDADPADDPRDRNS